MRSAYMTPEVALGTRRPDELDADLLVVPAFETAAAGDDRWLDDACSGALSRARAGSEFRGTLYDTFVTPITAAGWKTSRALLVGVGKPEDWTPERLRRVATTAGLYARQRHIRRLAFAPGSPAIPTPVAASAGSGIAPTVSQPTFFRMPSTSAVVKARRVWADTLPSLLTPTDNAAT